MSEDDADNLPAETHADAKSTELSVTAQDQQEKAQSLGVVGIGASAGGLEAVTKLLSHLKRKTGLAYVVVQHLSPDHASALPALLTSSTSMTVKEIKDGMAMQPDHVYVAPPGPQVHVQGRTLRLSMRMGHGYHMPIDHFFHSLAHEVGDRAIGVILSGTASDGSAGLRDISLAGGIALVQHPETASYDGMPRSAIATGVVDRVGSPAELAEELMRIGQHPYLREPGEAMPETKAQGEPPDTIEAQTRELFAILQRRTGTDFTNYKPATIQRRLHRRMVLQRMDKLADYLAFLRDNPSEVDDLYNDVLIRLTRFFREPDSFDALAQKVFPNLMAGRDGNDPIRIWVPACSTGEEAYSVAMTLLEFLGDKARSTAIQIFATDISEEAVGRGRAGLYPQTITEDVSEARLHQFFRLADGHYQISKSVRDLCVFAKQDVTRDPPFSRMDLILCRNLLIYLGPPLQKRLLGMLHYALKPSGFLMLGAAETVGANPELFTAVDSKHRIYRKKPMPFHPDMLLPNQYTAPPLAPATRPTPWRHNVPTAQSEADRMVLEKYGPAGVLVNDDLQIVQIRGQTGRYLEPTPGEASLSLLKMAKKGIGYELRWAIEQAKQTDRPVRREALSVQVEDRLVRVDLQVLPITLPGEREHFLVLFEESDHELDRTAEAETQVDEAEAPEQGELNQRAKRLERELNATRNYLQSIIQDLEAANEELQSANEEILSSNEELQSTNEELNTAKEELQSTNEELNTVNEELHGRNDELTQVNSDLVNLLRSVDIVIVIVGPDLSIRRFTPMAEKVLNLIPSDVGRPIGHLRPNIDCPDLEQLIRHTIDNVEPNELEVRDQEGRWYALRLRPYKTVDHRIDGAVLTLFDVSAARRRESEIRRAQQFVDVLVETVREPMLVLDGQLQVQRVNEAYQRTFGGSTDSLRGVSLYDIHDGGWDSDELKKLMEALKKGERINSGQSLPAPGGGSAHVELRPFATTEDGDKLILMVIFQP